MLKLVLRVFLATLKTKLGNLDLNSKSFCQKFRNLSTGIKAVLFLYFHLIFKC